MKKRIGLLAMVFMMLASCDILQHTLGTAIDPNPSQAEMAGGLKEALTQGVLQGVTVLSATNGFFNNSLYKIELPQEVKTAESLMRTFGFGTQVDRAVKALNEGAEMATAEARQVFVDAIRNMTVQDARSIVTGGNGSATRYLIESTTQSLTERFRPIIETSLDQVEATRYWSDVMNAYNTVSREQINPDLVGYVTERALSALFIEVETRENQIRENIQFRTSDLLKKVFEFADRERQQQ